jgi:hypothetical protein
MPRSGYRNVVKSDMELPPELVRIVSEFSKPRMKFIHEYNAAARKFNIVLSRAPVILPRIKKMLYTEKAEQVMTAFSDWVEEGELTKNAVYEMNVCGDKSKTTGWEYSPEWEVTFHELCSDARRHIDLRHKLYLKLNELLCTM